MKFLLEILGMTNQCNLNCDYCDWKKEAYYKLNNENIKSSKNNFLKIKQAIDEKFPELVMVEYSGGEPFMYPEIIDNLLDVFNDKWIRIISNGILIKDEQIRKMKEHGKTFVALSLDGQTLDANYPRIHGNKNLFNKILVNMDKLIKNKIPLMILCTINKYNINNFSQFISYLENNYNNEINNGMLVIPAHYVTNYSKDNGIPENDSANKLIKYLNENTTSKAINNIREHYESLKYYIKNNDRKYRCTIPDWALSMHFRKNSIVEEGNFLSFGCGMRGIEDLGTFNANSQTELDRYLTLASDKLLTKKVLKKQLGNKIQYKKDNCEEMCFVDWVSFDLIINGIISLEKASKWFVVFKDKQVQRFIENYKKNK